MEREGAGSHRLNAQPVMRWSWGMDDLRSRTDCRPDSQSGATGAPRRHFGRTNDPQIPLTSQIYEKEICLEPLPCAAMTILLRINPCSA